MKTAKKKAKKPATVKAKTVSRRRRGSTTPQPRAKAKRSTTFAEVRRQVEAAVMPPVPPPAPVPPPTGIDQSWRKSIDWVAAGKKAYESRMRNLALRQAAAGQVPTIAPEAAQRAAIAALKDAGVEVVPTFKRRKAPTAKPAAPKEEHTRRRQLTSSR